MFKTVLDRLQSTDRTRYGKAYRLWTGNEVYRIDNHNYKVCSSDGSFYVVGLPYAVGNEIIDPDEIECECPDYKQRGKVCKHIMAVMMYIDDQDIDLRKPEEVFETAYAAAEKFAQPVATLSPDVHELVVKIPRGTEKLRIVIEVE